MGKRTLAETEQDDEKRRQRARFVDALATSAQQPGERSRVGTRIAGAVAVLALAAGATLGLGAWRAYQSAEDEKAKQLAAERVATQKKLTEAPTPSAEQREKERKEAERKKKEKEAEEQKRKEQEAADRAAAAERAKQPPPAPAPEKTEDPNSPRNSGIELPRSKVLLKNVASKTCADLPGFGAGRPGKFINEHRCYPTDKDNQLWNIRVHYADRGPGGAPLVDIRNAKDGLCMDVPTRGPQPAGTPLSEAGCLPDVDEDNQLWWLEPAGGGAVKIRNYSSNHQCLRVGQAPPGGNDRRLILERCTDGPESRWLLQG